MPCACNSGTGDQIAQSRSQEREYEVRLPNGSRIVVKGEHAAKVEVTMAGGGTYSVR